VTKREPPAPIAHVVGVNARALRGGHKIDDVAKAVTARGLRWGPGRISDLEAGRVVPRVETLLVLAVAFSDLLGRPIALTDLLAGTGRVIVVDNVSAPLATVRAALSGQPATLPKSTKSEQLLRKYAVDIVPEMLAAISQLPPGRYQQLWEVWNDCGEAEGRTGRALGVDMGRLVEAMADTWGHTLSAERDARAPGASAQKRGQVTRQLRDELRKALGSGDH
jgi:hypothetical protein